MLVNKRDDGKFEIHLGSGPTHVFDRKNTARLARWLDRALDSPSPGEMQEFGTDYTDGQWIATTMGQFIQILVDSGSDPCIIFRVDEDMPAEGTGGAFIRKMTIYSVPNGAVVNMLGVLDMIEQGAIYKVLRQMIQAGLVR